MPVPLTKTKKTRTLALRPLDGGRSSTDPAAKLQLHPRRVSEKVEASSSTREPPLVMFALRVRRTSPGFVLARLPIPARGQQKVAICRDSVVVSTTEWS